jgi:hypothetical protein
MGILFFQRGFHDMVEEARSGADTNTAEGTPGQTASLLEETSAEEG